MVKPGWLVAALVVGLVIGFFAGRGTGTPASAEIAAMPGGTAQVAAGPAPPAGNPTRAAAAAPIPLPPPVGGKPPASHLQPGAGTAVAATVGDVQAIDVGPVFSKQFADSAAEGYRDAVAEAHHALEREARDDSWAYPMEADIENSLVADTSMGNFKKEHVECRASMCEVRLTAHGAEQAAALQRWNDGLRAQPWITRLSASSSSVVNNDNHVDALLIFTRPPPARKE